MKKGKNIKNDTAYKRRLRQRKQMLKERKKKYRNRNQGKSQGGWRKDKKTKKKRPGGRG